MSSFHLCGPDEATHTILIDPFPAKQFNDNLIHRRNQGEQTATTNESKQGLAWSFPSLPLTGGYTDSIGYNVGAPRMSHQTLWNVPLCVAAEPSQPSNLFSLHEAAVYFECQT